MTNPQRVIPPTSCRAARHALICCVMRMSAECRSVFARPSPRPPPAELTRRRKAAEEGPSACWQARKAGMQMRRGVCSCRMKSGVPRAGPRSGGQSAHAVQQRTPVRWCPVCASCPVATSPSARQTAVAKFQPSFAPGRRRRHQADITDSAESVTPLRQRQLKAGAKRR